MKNVCMQADGADIYNVRWRAKSHCQKCIALYRVLDRIEIEKNISTPERVSINRHWPSYLSLVSRPARVQSLLTPCVTHTKWRSVTQPPWVTQKMKFWRRQFWTLYSNSTGPSISVSRKMVSGAQWLIPEKAGVNFTITVPCVNCNFEVNKINVCQNKGE